MQILGSNFLAAIAFVVNVILEIYVWLIVARAVISWVSPDPYNPIVRFLYSATEPVLRPARKYIPPLGGTLDISPIVVLILLIFLQRAVVRSLQQFAAGM